MDLNKLKAEHPDVFQAAVAEGAAQERSRIAAIDALGLTGDFAKIAQDAKADGVSNAESVEARAFRAHKTKLSNIKAAVDQDAGGVPPVVEQGDAPDEGEKAVGLLTSAFKSKKGGK